MLFINESWIDDLISDAEISVPDYTSIHNDRSRDGVCVLAYIKNTLKFEHLKPFLSTSIESIWLKLFLGNKTVTTGTVYIPTVNTTRFESLMQHLVIVYSSLHDIILTGDFNIDSGQSKINIIEIVLNVKQLIKHPTHVTDTSSTTIDHIFNTSPEMQ